MKSKEELSALKKEIETLNQKLAELTEEELTQVNGGKVPLFGDTREEYSMNPEDINRSIYGALY